LLCTSTQNVNTPLILFSKILEIMEEYLTKSAWTPADYEAIADYAIEQWKAMK